MGGNLRGFKIDSRQELYDPHPPFFIMLTALANPCPNPITLRNPSAMYFRRPVR